MKIKAKFAGRCVECGYPFEVGDSIEWESGTKEATHNSCFLDKDRPRGLVVGEETNEDTEKPNKDPNERQSLYHPEDYRSIEWSTYYPKDKE